MIPSFLILTIFTLPRAVRPAQEGGFSVFQPTSGGKKTTGRHLLPFNRFRYNSTADYSSIINRRISAEDILCKKQLIGYNRHSRPRVNSSEAVLVTIGFNLMQINSLNEKGQVLSTTGYLSLSWSDDYLGWDEQKFEGLSSIILHPHQIWLPDVALDNTAQSIYDISHRRDFSLIVYSDGTVQWAPGGMFTTSCGLDITFYPYDEQRCHLVFTNWAYSGLKVNLTNESAVVELQDFTRNGEWDIVRTKALRGDRFYGEPFPFVQFTVFLRRKYYYHFVNILIPSTIMSALILLVFWLPPESGEKISLGITILLSFSVFMLMIAENLPKTSDSMPIIGFYLTFFMFSSSGSILVNVIVLNLHHTHPSEPIPPWLRKLILKHIARCICYKRPAHLAKRRDSDMAYHYQNGAISSSFNGVFPTSCAMMNPAARVAGYGEKWLSGGLGVMGGMGNRAPQGESGHSKRGSTGGGGGRASGNELSGEDSPIHLHRSLPPLPPFPSPRPLYAGHATGPAVSMPPSQAASARGTPPLGRRLTSASAACNPMDRHILQHLSKIADKQAQAEKEDQQHLEWREVAKIVDLFFFRVFGVLIALSTFVMLVVFPFLYIAAPSWFSPPDISSFHRTA